MAARKILILFAHPVLERSRVNRRLLHHIEDLDGVSIRDLYELYPDFAIDVATEQRVVREHDVVVFHHPFFWYSTPAILKEWQDLVLEHGWAYGEHGHALDGKLFFVATTTGGPAESYTTSGYNHATMRQLLAPLEQTARLCRMRYLAPFVVHGSLAMTSDEDVRPHGEAYRRLLEGLRDDECDIGEMEQVAEVGAQTLNDVLRQRRIGVVP